MKSYSRQQFEAEIAAGRASRQTSRLIKPGSEAEIQHNFFSWVDANSGRFPILNLIFAVPNGANLSKAGRAVMSLTGLRSGVPDVCVPVQRGVYTSLWIEFKRPLSGRLSETQKAWIAQLEKQGHKVAVLNTWPSAVDTVIAYLGIDARRLG